MDGLPGPQWLAQRPPVLSGASKTGLEVRHTFTHFHLVLSLATGGPELASHFPDARFVDDLSTLALPTLFAKALKVANLMP